MEELSRYPFDDTLSDAWIARWIERLHDRYREQLQTYQTAYRQHLDFVHLWVHQMKTPLSGLSLLWQQQRPRTPEERERWLQTEETVEKLAEGLDSVLHMARLQDFALDVHIRRTDLLQQVKEVIHSRKRTMIRLGIFPRIDAEDGSWLVYTDPKWNKVILEQILSNALKYGSQTDKEEQCVRFGLRREGEEVVLTISDDGPGIPPQDLPRVFEPFFTGENGRRFSHATGVGLYMVKQVTERLGHQVKVTSAQGEGTCVTLRYRGERVVSLD
jgi:signal transduction histidine kinase